MYNEIKMMQLVAFAICFITASHVYFAEGNRECKSSPCLNDGTCTENKPGSGYTCQCAPGYEGTHCDSDIDECSSNPCGENGNCCNEIDGYICHCDIGYTGLRCETRIDECLSFPCKHNATCFDDMSGYNCSCADGYSGIQCEIDINECLSCPCQNLGICIDGVALYKCVCAEGYTGTHCEADIDECASSPCAFGNCTDHVAAYICHCPNENAGLHCEKVWQTPLDGDAFQYYGDDTQVGCETALAICNMSGGSLSSIHSNQENRYLASLFNASVEFWIGLSKPGHVTNFSWTDGTDVDYIQWFHGEPNIPNTDCACGSLFPTNLSWADQPCERNYSFVCKKENPFATDSSGNGQLLLFSLLAVTIIFILIVAAAMLYVLYLKRRRLRRDSNPQTASTSNVFACSTSQKNNAYEVEDEEPRTDNYCNVNDYNKLSLPSASDTSGKSNYQPIYSFLQKEEEPVDKTEESTADVKGTKDGATRFQLTAVQVPGKHSNVGPPNVTTAKNPVDGKSAKGVKQKRNREPHFDQVYFNVTNAEGLMGESYYNVEGLMGESYYNIGSVNKVEMVDNDIYDGADDEQVVMEDNEIYRIDDEDGDNGSRESNLYNDDEILD